MHTKHAILLSTFVNIAGLKLLFQIIRYLNLSDEGLCELPKHSMEKKQIKYHHPLLNENSPCFYLHITGAGLKLLFIENSLF